MYLRSIRLKNTGPISQADLELPFDGDRPKPVVLVGPNGSGKSTVLSFIVNAMVGMKQRVYSNAEIEAGKVYRLRSAQGIHGAAAYYAARLEFDKGVQLVEWQLNKKKSEFEADELAGIDPTWSEIPQGETSFFSLKMGEIDTSDKTEEMINSTALLYFGADRFEISDWVNAEDLKDGLSPPPLDRVKGRTSRRIFARQRLKPTLDWFSSVLHDMFLAEHQPVTLPVTLMPANEQNRTVLIPARISIPGPAHAIFECVRTVLTCILCKDVGDVVKLQIGHRKSRILSVEIEREGVQIRVIKDLLSLSAGESALFCLFAGLLHDADLSHQAIASPADIVGLVVIDEVDLHLHVGLQYEAIPKLIALFPKVQFIISCHAPLVVMGLAKQLGEEGFDVRELPSGARVNPESYVEFLSAFQAYSKTRLFESELIARYATSLKPIVMVEGRSDAALILIAWSKLYPGILCDYELVPCGIEPDPEKRNGGAEMLRRCIEFFSAVSAQCAYALFDFDRKGFEEFNGLNKRVFAQGADAYHKRHLAKPVHAILLPVPSSRQKYVNHQKPIYSFLTIESYFSDEILKNAGYTLTEAIAGSGVFENEASSAIKMKFSAQAASLAPEHFTEFEKLFNRIKTLK
jgi:predicted ATP-binding protein involved in virulence